MKRLLKFVQKLFQATKIAFTKASTEGYANPPIPDGYEHTEGEVRNGFVIKNILNGNEFVWIPVDMVDASGTLDRGWHYSHRFGRRANNLKISYSGTDFIFNKYKEKIKVDLIKQIRSIKKYGGFYYSRYFISLNADGNLQSVKEAEPLIVEWDDANEFASKIENRKGIKSHLVYACEHDTVIAWIGMTDNSIFEDTKKSEITKVDFNNICDLYGEIAMWTQEYMTYSYPVDIEGFSYIYRGGASEKYYCSPAGRGVNVKEIPIFLFQEKIGFRAALYIE